VKTKQPQTATVAHTTRNQQQQHPRLEAAAAKS